MIKYMVVKDNGMTEIETDDKNKAADSCINLGISVFYEIETDNRITPRGIWEIKSVQDDGGYNFKYKSWREVIAEGCKN